jgi:hypothetical protein
MFSTPLALAKNIEKAKILAMKQNVNKENISVFPHPCLRPRVILVYVHNWYY